MTTFILIYLAIGALISIAINYEYNNREKLEEEIVPLEVQISYESNKELFFTIITLLWLPAIIFIILEKLEKKRTE